MKLRLIILLLSLFVCGCGLFNKTPTIPIITNPEITVKKVWMSQPNEGAHGTYLRLMPAVSETKVITVDELGMLTAVDKQTGRIVWRNKVKRNLMSSPIVVEDKIFVGSDTRVFAFSLETGKEIWKAPVPNQVSAAPAYANNKVYVKTIDGKLMALEAETGKVVWQYNQNVPRLILQSNSAPVVAYPLVLAGFSDGHLVALTADEGKLVWEQMVGIPSGFSELARMIDISADPVVEDNVVYVVSYQGALMAINLANGHMIWQHPLSSHAGIAVNRKAVFATDTNGRVWAFNRANGEILWRQNELQDRFVSGPTLIGQYLEVSDDDGFIHWMDQDDGHFVSRQFFSPGGVIAPAVVDDDILYLTSRTGTLVALRSS